MSGYYTVELVGASVAGARRIALETAFARELERALGGPQQATALCLAAAAPQGADARGQVEAARAQALAAVQGEAPGVQFAIRVWSAEDL